MVRRIYVEKKPALRQEAAGLLAELRTVLGVAALEDLRLLNRYDAEGLEESVFRRAAGTVFSEPQVDDAAEELPQGEWTVLAVEPLPGQFDQRADSAAQCVQMMAGGERPLIACAKVYLLSGALTEADLAKIRSYLINPVESREAALEKPETLSRAHEIPDHVETVGGFTAMGEEALSALLDRVGDWGRKGQLLPEEMDFSPLLALTADERRRIAGGDLQVGEHPGALVALGSSGRSGIDGDGRLPIRSRRYLHSPFSLGLRRRSCESLGLSREG